MQPEISKKTVFTLLFVFLLALWFRFQFVHPNLNDIPVVRDASEYVNYGRNLVYHGTYSRESAVEPVPDAYRSPGYPLLIAFSIVVGGEQHYRAAVVLIQVVLSALLVPLTFLTGIYLLSARGAMVSALLVAVNPHLIAATSCILTETLFAFLLLLAIWLFHYALAKEHILPFVIAGVCFGLAYLTNEITLFLPFVFACIAMLGGALKQKAVLRDRRLLNVFVFLVVFSLFPGNWLLRNHLQLPDDAKRGVHRAVMTLSHGAYPDFVYKNPQFKRFPYREDPMQPAFGESIDNFIRILWARFKNEPVRYLKWYLIGKPRYLWSWDIIQGVGDVYIYPVKVYLFENSKLAHLIKVTMRFFHPFLFFLSLAGIPLYYVVTRNKGNAGFRCNSPSIIFASCIYATLIYMVFAPWPRYSIPFRPELYLCSMWSLTVIFRYLFKRGEPT